MHLHFPRKHEIPWLFYQMSTLHCWLHGTSLMSCLPQVSDEVSTASPVSREQVLRCGAAQSACTSSSDVSCTFDRPYAPVQVLRVNRRLNMNTQLTLRLSQRSSWRWKSPIKTSSFGDLLNATFFAVLALQCPWNQFIADGKVLQNR